jgi:hypothetical protein
METNYNSLTSAPVANSCSFLDKPLVLSRLFGVKPPKRWCCCEAHLGLIGLLIVCLIAFIINLFSSKSSTHGNCIEIDYNYYCIPETVDSIWQFSNTIGTLIVTGLVLFGYFKKNVMCSKIGYMILFILDYIFILFILTYFTYIIVNKPIYSLILLPVWFGFILLIEYILLLFLSTIEHIKDSVEAQQVHPILNSTDEA